MPDYSGVTWRVNYGEIAEREQFRVGYIGMESYDAYFPVSQLSDLITTLNAVIPLGLGVTAKGASVQAVKVAEGVITRVRIQPRLDTGTPSQIMSLRLVDLADFLYALGLFQTAVSSVSPDDWDLSKPTPITPTSPFGQLIGNYIDGEIDPLVTARVGDKVVELAIPNTQKGVANGVASVDALGFPLAADGSRIIPENISAELFNVLDKKRYPSIIPLSDPNAYAVAADVGPAINAALAALPNGSYARIPAGVYVTRTAITPPQGVVLWGYGVRFIVDSLNGRGLQLNGVFDPTYAVASLTEERPVVESGNKIFSQRITINQEIPETWVRGDVVQMFCEDWIPGSRPGSGTAVAGVTTVSFAATGDLFTTDAAHTLAVGDGVYITTPSPTGATSGVFNRQRYYVKTVPSTTTFTVSETFNGPTLDVLLDGTAVGVDKAISESRIGQHMRVLSFTKGGGTTVVDFSGRLNDPMTTNIRVARLRSEIRHQAAGFKFERSQLQMDAGSTGAIIGIVGTVGARLSDIEIVRNGSGCILSTGTYGTLIERLTTGWGWNDAAVHFGYGVIDNSSSYLTMRDSLINDVRHAYSDDTSRILAISTSAASYGRSFGNRIVDCTAINASSSAFDTHHCSQAVEFINVTAINCWNGVGLRGRRHTVRNLVTRLTRNGLSIFTEDGGGDSWGHDIDGILLDRCIGYGVQVLINTGKTSDNPGRLWNVRETRRSRISNVRVAGASTVPETVGAVLFAISTVNATLTLEDPTHEAGAVLADSNQNIVFDNSSIEGLGDWFLDYAENTAGASIWGISLLNGSDVHIPVLRMRTPAGGLGGRFTRLVSGTTADTIRVDRAILDEVPAFPVNAVGANSYVNYHGIRTSESSAYQLATGVTNTGDTWLLRLSRTTEDFFLVVNIAADATMVALPAGKKYGQKLTIESIGAGKPTVVHGASGLTNLMGSVNKVLAQFKSIELIWTDANGGRWRQSGGTVEIP